MKKAVSYQLLALSRKTNSHSLEKIANSYLNIPWIQNTIIYDL